MGAYLDRSLDTMCFVRRDRAYIVSRQLLEGTEIKANSCRNLQKFPSLLLITYLLILTDNHRPRAGT